MAHNKELSFELDIYSLVLINLADQILASQSLNPTRLYSN